MSNPTNPEGGQGAPAEGAEYSAAEEVKKAMADAHRAQGRAEGHMEEADRQTFIAKTGGWGTGAAVDLGDGRTGHMGFHHPADAEAAANAARTQAAGEYHQAARHVEGADFTAQQHGVERPDHAQDMSVLYRSRAKSAREQRTDFEPPQNPAA